MSAIFIKKLLQMYSMLMSRPVFYKFNRFLLLLSLRGVGVLNYENEYISGEKGFLRSILKEIDQDTGILVDIGSNEGDFSDYAIKHSQLLSVVAFEPHPSTYSRVKKRFNGNKRVTVINKGIGFESGTFDLFDYEGESGSGHATMLQGVIEDIHNSKSIVHQIDVIPLDGYHFDGDINFVKIDVEGAEESVLKGMQKVLNTNNVKYVLIEFNEMNVKSKTFLKNIIDLMKEYKVFRILPGGKLIELNKPYRAWTHEIFAYQNIVFIRN